MHTQNQQKIIEAIVIPRAYEEKRACNSQCIYCVSVILLMSQQDMLYLANRPLGNSFNWRKNGLGLRLVLEPVHKVHAQVYFYRHTPPSICNMKDCSYMPSSLHTPLVIIDVITAPEKINSTSKGRIF